MGVTLGERASTRRAGDVRSFGWLRSRIRASPATAMIPAKSAATQPCKTARTTIRLSPHSYGKTTLNEIISARHDRGARRLHRPFTPPGTLARAQRKQ